MAVGIIAWAFGSRDSLATTMCFNAFKRQVILSTFCEKRHDAAVVMDNKISSFFSHILVLIAIIALVGCYFLLPSAHENTN